MIQCRYTLVLLVATGLLASIRIEAQPRGRPVGQPGDQVNSTKNAPEGREQILEALRVWLGRLAGRFDATTRSLGTGGPTVLPSGREIFPDPPLSHALDCAPVGSGPGISCLFQATDSTTGELSLAYLFGVDVDRLGIRFLWLDAQGHAREGFGKLKGNTLEVKIPCAASSACLGDRTMRFTAPDSARRIDITFEANVRLPRNSVQTIRNGWKTELRRQ